MDRSKEQWGHLRTESWVSENQVGIQAIPWFRKRSIPDFSEHYKLFSPLQENVQETEHCQLHQYYCRAELLGTERNKPCRPCSSSSSLLSHHIAFCSSRTCWRAQECCLWCQWGSRVWCSSHGKMTLLTVTTNSRFNIIKLQNHVV